MERKQRGMIGCALTKDQRTCNDESDHCSDDERRRLRQQVKECNAAVKRNEEKDDYRKNSADRIGSVRCHVVPPQREE